MNSRLQQATASSASPITLAPDRRTSISVRAAIAGDGATVDGDGIARGFTNDHGTVTFSVRVERAGVYALRVLARSPFGEKAFEMRVGDGAALTARLTKTTGASPVPFDAGLIDLPGGVATLTVGRGWGYYEITGIELMIAPSPASLRPLPAIPVDPKATLPTRQLLRRITANYGRATFSGQYDIPECDYVRSVSGRLPAILGGDLMEYSPSRREHGANPKDYVETLIRAAKTDRAILTLSWHWNAPAGLLDRMIRAADGSSVDARWYKGFNSNASTFDFSAALANPNSENHRLLLRDIDAIGVQLSKFADADIPVLWRPLHEADGGWFWWGSHGPRAFVALWRLLYERLTRDHGLHNLLWVSCSGLKPEWYPGDAYVDVVGLDAYPADTGDPLVPDWKTLFARFDGIKPIALTEFGGVPDIARMQRYGVRWAYFVSWTGDSGPRKMSRDVLKRLYGVPEVVNR